MRQLRLPVGHRSDRASVSPKLDSNGYSVWVTPKTTKGWEGLLRFDHLEREQTTTTVKGKTDRTIAGVSYWFPHQGNVSTVLLFDYEQVNYDDFATGPARREAVGRAHAGEFLGSQ